ncbi:MAG: exo-alpha-sialidase [Clostridia bacterium]|nr:exo-alpha-sialidase [Clostridia bacterium]
MKTIKEFVCNPLPTKNAHASTILPLPDGSVITAWFGGVKEGTKDVDIWYCKRDENGWGTPKSLSYNKNIPHWNPVLFLRENGDILLYFKVGKRIPTWRTFVSVSTDGGETFGTPYELVEGDRSGGRGPVKNKCLRLSDGRILAPASSEIKGWNCFVDTSFDDGLTWKKGAKIKTEQTAPILNSLNKFTSNLIPMIQPTLWESEPGKVHMLTRTAVGRAYRSDSDDYGQTWCQAYPTDLPNNNSGLDVVKTPDGCLYLISNPVSENWGERSPLTLQKSSDNGATWETVLVLEEEKLDSEFSYPGIHYLNGALYICYTWERLNVAYWRIEL